MKIQTKMRVKKNRKTMRKIRKTNHFKKNGALGGNNNGYDSGYDSTVSRDNELPLIHQEGINNLQRCITKAQQQIVESTRKFADIEYNYTRSSPVPQFPLLNAMEEHIINMEEYKYNFGDYNIPTEIVIRFKHSLAKLKAHHKSIEYKLANIRTHLSKKRKRDR